MMWWHDGGPGWTGWLAMSIMMAVFWALLIAGGFAIYHSLRREYEPGAQQREALRILDERFASGEIDADEYMERRDLLNSR